MRDGIEKAIHGCKSHDTAPSMHPEFFCFYKSYALFKNKRQKQDQSNRVAEKYNGVIINSMGGVTNADSHH
ncbi:hypothetical protein GCM10011446_13650 [Acinetobacter vivianii]|nr:hypothetical protein GCM10011446_13650 [Acinetobacter vivianii]